MTGPTGTVFGQRQQQPNASTTSIPGVGSTEGGIANLNLPGSQIGKSSTPSLDGTMGGASKLHTPGEVDDQGGIEAAQQAIAKMTARDNGLLNQAARGGVNGLNIPTQSMPGVDVSRDTGNQNQNPTRLKAPDDANYDVVVKEDPYSTFNGTYKPDGTKVVYGDTTPPPPPDHSGDAYNGTIATTAAGVIGGPAAAIAAAATSVVFNIIKVVSGSDPDPTDSGSTTSTAGGLAPNSPVAKKDNGGGTGNNSEATGGQIGGLAAGSAYATRNHGDGGGDDAGDNNRISKDGALATGSTLARKDQGDGGGSDSRGGGGATSVITSASKPVNPGRGHNQMSATAARTE